MVEERQNIGRKNIFYINNFQIIKLGFENYFLGVIECRHLVSEIHIGMNGMWV